VVRRRRRYNNKRNNISKIVATFVYASQRWKKGWKQGRNFPESIMVGRSFQQLNDVLI
jgi:hypothetical protein